MFLSYTTISCSKGNNLSFRVTWKMYLIVNTINWKRLTKIQKQISTLKWWNIISSLLGYSIVCKLWQLFVHTNLIFEYSIHIKGKGITNDLSIWSYIVCYHACFRCHLVCNWQGKCILCHFTHDYLCSQNYATFGNDLWINNVRIFYFFGYRIFSASIRKKMPKPDKQLIVPLEHKDGSHVKSF